MKRLYKGQIMTKDEQTIANLKKLGADIDRAIEVMEQESAFQKKAGIVISQLRADRDGLLNAFDKIRAEFIARYPKNWAGDLELGGRSCVFSLNQVLAIIDKYKPESEDKE